MAKVPLFKNFLLLSMASISPAQQEIPSDGCPANLRQTNNLEYPGSNPGKAKASLEGNIATLENDLFSASFKQTQKGIIFHGMKTANGEKVAEEGTCLFTVNLQGGKSYNSAAMKSSPLKIGNLKANPSHPQLAKRFSGKSVSATFTAPDDSFTVEWKAVLRNGSHYLRQEFVIKAHRDTAFTSIVPLQYNISKEEPLRLSGNTSHGKVAVNEQLFAGLETPMSLMSVGGNTDPSGSVWSPERWEKSSFGCTFSIPDSFTAKYGDAFSAKDGPAMKHLAVAEGETSFEKAGENAVTFRYLSGNNKLNILGVQLLNSADAIVSEDVHPGTAGQASKNNTYHITIPRPGTYKLRYWAETKTEPLTSKGEISFSLPPAKSKKPEKSNAPASMTTGTWERKTVLRKGQKWEVSQVLGFFAPQQQRRSFLVYSEREKASAYRPFIHYNDWYEIGIRLHDHKDPAKRTSEAMWLELLDTWYREMYVKRKTNLDAFVIDDGWDDFNSLWDFHVGFPRGFSKLNASAHRMKAGLGTWLGPVGGYGASKRQRLDNWNRTHPQNKIGNFQLSNDEYFNAFTGRCKQMLRDYDMRYFKFDGISAIPVATGPGNTEDAEGIIRVLSELRRARPDLFINTTVGTWASPFWFHYSDSIWRQDNDFGRLGSMGDPRDQWITYRDQWVHKIFVTAAPLFPINSIMTHGTIITKNGPPRVMSKEPANCTKEMRCAFGSGSALQEIYVDQDLMMQQNGALWNELAACIKWVRRNQDVLADVHWVGGAPWNPQTMDGDIYGWASWNRKKSTLTLRNSSDHEKTLSSTLRKILDVPPYLKGSVVFSHSFRDQRNIPSLIGKAVDVDKDLTITLKPQEVIVLEGVNDMKGSPPVFKKKN